MAENGKPGTNLQRWGDYGEEAVQEEKKALKTGDMMKLEVGENVVRFLPPRVGQKSPFVVVSQHFFEKPDGETASFPCPRVMAGRQCVLCSKSDELAKSHSRADRDRAWKLKPQKRVFALVIDRTAPELGVQVLAFGKTIKEGLDAIRLSRRTGGNYTHPYDGFDVIITRVGTGKNDTEYSVAADRPQQGESWDDFKARSRLGANDEEIQEIMDAAPDLDRYAVVPDDEEIFRRLGIDPGDVQREPPPSRGRMAAPPPPRGGSVQEAVEEEGEWTDAGGDDIPF